MTPEQRQKFQHHMPSLNGVKVELSIKIPAHELQMLSAQQNQALFLGIAEVLEAANRESRKP